MAVSPGSCPLPLFRMCVWRYSSGVTPSDLRKSSLKYFVEQIPHSMAIWPTFMLV